MSEEADVQRFYERFPYPPPVDSLEQYRLLWQDRQRRRADHLLFQPAKPFREDPTILIAGCGTSQAAKHAIRWPAAQVTGIDFSATSVRCTEELKRNYTLDNLTVLQLSVERAGELQKEFDQIVCTGVLHHLPNPDAGLQALRGVLKPEGSMHLMTYAPYGRTGIYMLQEFCRRVGVPATEQGIEDLAIALRSLPTGHPLKELLRETPDFRHPAAVADALLNPQDRAYSVRQLFEFLEGGGLMFGRWIAQALYSPHCGVIEGIPQAPQMAQLEIVEQYAAVELFRGTMLSHSLVAYRDDRPGGSPQPDFGGSAWPGYVPIRLPDTVCIQERLPAGAAAVLINRTHPFRDLVLAIDAVEKKLFDAIDGSCSLADMPADSQTTKRFFERLWLWDQIVIDASGGK